MNPRNRSFLLVFVAAGLTACVGGAGAPSVAVGEAPLDVNRAFGDVRAQVAENGELSYSAALSCANGPRHCRARIATDAVGHPVSPQAGGGALTPADLQAAYGLDVTKNPDATVAIVDAYGYPGLESDLATYRSMYNLPPCTTANGCLKIVNQKGQTSPLPASDGQGCNGWAGETALDVDMVSAACPTCKILVVQSDDDDQACPTSRCRRRRPPCSAPPSSATAGAAPTRTRRDITNLDKYFDLSPHKTGIFVASGDDGWNNAGAGQGMTGPDFPSTSEYVIAVGGTIAQEVDVDDARLDRDRVVRRRQLVQPVDRDADVAAGITTGCSFRAACDVAAVADPAHRGQHGVRRLADAGRRHQRGVAVRRRAFRALRPRPEQGRLRLHQQERRGTTSPPARTAAAATSCATRRRAGTDRPASARRTARRSAPSRRRTPTACAPPDMATPPDMTTPPDMAEPTGNGGRVAAAVAAAPAPAATEAAAAAAVATATTAATAAARSAAAPHQRLAGSGPALRDGGRARVASRPPVASRAPVRTNLYTVGP